MTDSRLAQTRGLAGYYQAFARLYHEAGLAIRTKTLRRRRAAVVRETPAHPTATNQSWAMDSMHDALADGTKIRL